MLDEAICRGLVQLHAGLLRACLNALDLLEILLHARQLAEDGVLGCLDAMQAEVG
jgi:hypothetical protein